MAARDDQLMCAGNGQNINESWGTEVVINDTVLGAGQLHITDASAAITIANTPALGKMIWLRLKRRAADGTNDTMTGDAAMEAGVVGWKESATESAVW